MANTLGQLIVKLSLDATEFVTGMTRSEAAAQRLARNVDRQLSGLATLAKSGFLIAGGAAALMAKQIVSDAAALDDLADSTGSSVESLSKLANQAKISGRDFQTLQSLVLRLSAGLNGVEDEGTSTARALAALGVTARDPVEALNQVALSLNKYADGTAKAALARDIFGKQGPAFLATLKDIAETQNVAATVTAEQAAKAEELEKAIRRLGVEGTTFKDLVLDGIVPALLRYIEETKEGIRITGGFVSAIATLGTTNPFASIGEQLADTNAKIRALTENGDMQSKWANALGVGDSVMRRLQQRKEFLQFQERQAALAGAAALGFTGDARDLKLAQKPQLKYDPSKPGNDDTARRLLDARLKELDRAIREEEDTLRQREHFLQSYYQDGLIEVVDYYQRRQAAIDESVTKQRAAYAREEALLRQFRPKDEKERIKAQSDLADVIAKREKLEQEAALKGIDLYIEQARAVRQFQASLDQINLALANARGDTVGAAALGFDLQNQALRQQIELQKQSADAGLRAQAFAGGAALDELRQRVIQQAQLSKATQDYALSMDELAVAQARVDIAFQSGAITELDALRKRSDLTTAYVAQLQAELAAVEAIARASGRREDLVRVEQLKVQLEALAAQGDLVAKKFNDVFSGALTDGLADAISGTKSLSDAFRSMERQIINSLSRIAAQNIAESIFGKGGAGAGAGSFLSDIFGGSGGFLASLFSSGAAPIPSFATGTDFHSGGLALVGERGPELVNLPRGAQVIPNSELQSRRSARAAPVNHFHINVLPGASRATADQAALATGRAVTSAIRQNG